MILIDIANTFENVFGHTHTLKISAVCNLSCEICFKHYVYI